MPTDTEWAYLAGLFDGEGNVTITVAQRGKERRPYHGIRVTVTNTDRALLQWVTDHFGGKVNNGAEPSGKGVKRCFQIHWQHRELPALVAGMRPYAVCKARQLDIVSEFRATLESARPGLARNRVTPEIEVIRDRLHRELNALNGNRPAVFIENFRAEAIPYKAFCLRGHPLVKGNLCAGPKRQCLTCHRDRETKRRENARA